MWGVIMVTLCDPMWPTLQGYRGQDFKMPKNHRETCLLISAHIMTSLPYLSQCKIA